MGFPYALEHDSAAMGVISHEAQVMRLDFLKERNCLGFILCNIQMQLG